MKHVFIVNPSAGPESSVSRVRELTMPYRSTYDIEVYETVSPGEATVFIRNYCKNRRHGEKVRFYACGGDGTLNEVAQGVYENENVSMSCYPCGSGNDFVKYYGGKDRFMDIGALLRAEEHPIDLMKAGDRVAINVTNFGFDAAAAETMIKIKKKPLIGGKNAYYTGIVKALFTSMRTRCSVYADGELLNPDGVMMLCTVACGQYVGGAFRCAPHSVNDDGLLDVCLVSPVSRLKVASLIGPYTRGEHLSDPRFEKYITYRRARSIRVEATPGFILCVDGEIIHGDSFDIKVLPGAIDFAVPRVSVPAQKEAVHEV